MAKPKFLLIPAILPFLLSVVTTPGGIADGSCTRVQKLAGTCADINGSLGDREVTLIGDGVVPGSGSRIPSDSGGAENGSGSSSPGGVAPETGSRVLQPGDPFYREGYTVTGPVRLTDLVNFRPVAGTSHMEPDGWMIVGLDTNFYARASIHVQDRILLGRPASVRFTPVRFRWLYGDGTSASRAFAGTTWAAQTVGEFDATTTSHIYDRAGTYVINLTVDFAAEYRYAAGDWTPIAGTLPIAANALTATAGDARTVLVSRDCTVETTGPGC